MKTAFIYGGQGSQKVGMGKELYEKFNYIQEFYDSIKLDFPLKELSFSGDLETISKTRYTQPILLAFQLAVTKILEKNSIKPDVVLGLSLGEYSALYATRVLEEKDAVKIINKRSKLMEEVEKKVDSKMLALFTDDIDLVNKICKSVSKENKVEISNINTKKQIVISGEKSAVLKSRELLNQEGVRSVELNTSGPFHTSYMVEVSEKLFKLFQEIKFNKPRIPIIYNLLGNYSESNTKEIMAKQVCNKVLFKDSLERLLESHVDLVIEIGYGNVIKGFIRKINKNIKVMSANTLESIKEIIRKVKNHDI